LKQLIRFPSYQVSADKVANGMKECASFLSQSLKGLGYKVEVDDLLNVTAEKDFEGEKSFLINTHFDTVVPSSRWEDALTPRLDGNRLYGLVSSDAKGGIAAILSALSCLDDCRFGKLVVQFMNFEDNSIECQGRRLLGMPYFLSNNPGFKADYGINVEPTVIDDKWTVNLGCTGRVSFGVTARGREVHSSTPHLGRNAIYDMAKIIDEIRRIPPGRFKINDFDGEMPINVAMIEGGRAINIVPEECKITCERRLFPGEDPEMVMEMIRSRLQKIEGANVKCDFNANVQLPYFVREIEEVVSLVIDSALRALEYRPRLRISLGRTDSMYLYHIAGIKTVIIGPGNKGHIVDEYISTDRLLEFTEVLAMILGKPP
jgi:acetylornithine deacetylase/succinyl-diaminopimelate desuccinylase-like protein